MPRKLVIFGDCTGGTKNARFAIMCGDASRLIHECTNAAISERMQRKERGKNVRVNALEDNLTERNDQQPSGVYRQSEGENTVAGSRNAQITKDHITVDSDRDREAVKRKEVQKKALGRGHSTPKEVGEFAVRINARRLVVNHFSAM